MDRVDWNEVWKQKMSAHLEENAVLYFEGAGVWDTRENAELYWKRAQKGGYEQERKTIESLKLSPGSRVLDIGAGPGVTSLLLSKKVARVTAVEPSSYMVDVFKRNMEEQHLDNIRIIQKKWEEIDPGKDLDGPYDAVFAAYSLFVRDLRSAILKMEQASTGFVFIYWFLGEGAWEGDCAAVWPLLHGKAYCPRPKTDILYQVLYQMGIHAKVEVFCMPRIKRFSGFGEAVAYYGERFRASGKEQEGLIAAYLKKVLTREANSLVLRKNPYFAKIWWKKE